MGQWQCLEHGELELDQFTEESLETAVNIFTRVYEIDSKTIAARRALLSKGQAYFWLQRFDDAKKSFRLALSKGESSAEPYLEIISKGEERPHKLKQFARARLLWNRGGKQSYLAPLGQARSILLDLNKECPAWALCDTLHRDIEDLNRLIDDLNRRRPPPGSI